MDLDLLGGWENDTHTSIRFRRAWDTCDDQDMVLGTNTVRLIWAYHRQDPVDDRIIYHGTNRRGTRSISLNQEKVPSESSTTDFLTWDVLSGRHPLPSSRTHYWCKMHRSPDLAEKHHIVGFNTAFQPGNEKYLHHIILYECLAPDGNDDDMFGQFVDEPGHTCYVPTMPRHWWHCLSGVMRNAWGVGSPGEMLPDHVGQPMGGEERERYFLLQMHYDNPDMDTGVVDNSGLSILYTDKLREHDVFHLNLGVSTNVRNIIPPIQESFISGGRVSAECTSAGLPVKGINVISGGPHTHLGKPFKHLIL